MALYHSGWRTAAPSASQITLVAAAAGARFAGESNSPKRRVAAVRWVANPFRGDAFEAAWLPAAEAVLDYGAAHWSFYRAKDGLLDFTQHALFPEKEPWERYWYSEEIATARAEASGLYQVPLLPTFHAVVGSGSTLDAPTTTGSPLT